MNVMIVLLIILGVLTILSWFSFLFWLCQKQIPPTIPQKIFQTHKSVDYINDNEILKKAVSSWKDCGYQHYFYNDQTCEHFMRTEFPDIYQLWNKLPLQVMKADLWRYCIIYRYGGIYADADTTLLVNPRIFIKNSYLVCAPENDTHYLCQWVFAAPKGSPILKRIIDLVISRLEGDIIKLAKENEHFVHYATGPAAFTDGIKLWLEENGKPTDTNCRNEYLWVYEPNNFHASYVQHHFSGSWDNGWKSERDDFLDKI